MPIYPIMETDFFEMGNEDEDDSISSFLGKRESKATHFNDNGYSDEEITPFLYSFLTELVTCLKNTLLSLNSFVSLAMDGSNDAETKEHSQKMASETIKTIDALLNNLLNYINVNKPIVKKDTVNIVLEEILEAHEKQIQDKNIQIYKKCEKDLPETYMHNQQVRFILNSVVQYAILCTPPHGSIGFVIKYYGPQNGPTSRRISREFNGAYKNGGRRMGEEYIGVAIGFSGNNESDDQHGNIMEILAPKKEATHLILQLAEEIIRKNHGALKVGFDEKNSRMIINMKFSIERRKAFYYEPMNF
jgi:hypothetical protein